MLKPINIGHLDRRITIQSQATSKDADGFPVETWSNIYTNVPASRKYGPGTEKEENGQNTPEQSVEYLLKYAAGITNQFRVVEDGKIYEIHAVEEIGRRQGLLLMCKSFGNTE